MLMTCMLLSATVFKLLPFASCLSVCTSLCLHTVSPPPPRWCCCYPSRSLLELTKSRCDILCLPSYPASPTLTGPSRGDMERPPDGLSHRVQGGGCGAGLALRDALQCRAGVHHYLQPPPLQDLRVQNQSFQFPGSEPLESAGSHLLGDW